MALILLDAAGVALLGAGGGEEGLHDRRMRVGVHELRAQGEDVGVVVLARVRAAAPSAQDAARTPGHLVGGHGRADAGAVHQDARARASPARTARATASAMSG